MTLIELLQSFSDWNMLEDYQRGFNDFKNSVEAFNITGTIPAKERMKIRVAILDVLEQNKPVELYSLLASLKILLAEKPSQTKYEPKVTITRV